jgi:serine/threonine-protein kinase RsbW
MPTEKCDVLELRIPSTYDAMERVAGLIEEAGRRVGICEDDEVDLMISVMEAVNNAIQHGNEENPEKGVHIRIVTEPDALTCTVRDEGGGFDPARVPDPLSAENLLNPSGRGILMMREFMDDVDFTTESGGTLVRMRKRFRPATQNHA